MEDEYGDVPHNWGRYVFQGANEGKTLSIYDNQNCLKTPKFDPCVIRLRKDDQSALIEPDPECSVRIYIEGGSDFPRIRLRLTVGAALDPLHDTWAIFRPWAHAGNAMDRPAALPGTHQPPTASFSFSDILTNLTLQLDVPLTDESRTRYASVIGRSGPAKLSWNYSQPVCFNFNASLDHLQPLHRDKVQHFRKITQTNTIEVLTKASLKMKESYNFFVAQPSPTPPHFHRWAKRIKINEPAVGEIPFPDRGSDLEAMFRKRERGWPGNFPGTWIDPYEISYMAAPIRYIDERQYETFKMGEFYREDQGRVLGERRATWNGRYGFDFRACLTSTHVADRSWLIRLSLNADREELPPPPEPGKYCSTLQDPPITNRPDNTCTHVELEVRLDTFGPVEKFVGRTIAGTFGDSEYDVGMIVKRLGGRGGFVLVEHVGRFRFGPAEAQTSEMRSAVRRVMYGGNGVSQNNWLKKILLLHDIPRGRGQMFRSNLAEEFIRHQPLNAVQEEAFRDAVGVPGTTLRSRLSIVQGSPGTGKTNLSCVIMRFYLLQNVNVLFIAASNQAVDIAAGRLLKQLQANDEATHGIYRIKVDALEQITADPDMRLREEDDEWTEGGRRLEIETEGSPPSPSFTTINPIDIAIQASLEQYLEQQLTGTSADTLSLPNHILGRYRVINNRSQAFKPRTREDAAEHHLIKRLIAARARCESWDFVQTAGALDEHNNPINNFNSTWLEVQKFYIMNARLILATTAVASSKACRVFRVQAAMMDEGSQMREVESIGAIARHVTPQGLAKIVILGDPKQLPPCVLFKLSEFFASTVLTLQSRLMNGGCEYLRLNVQYRMHPDISSCVNKLFYDANVRDSPSTFNRPDAERFRDWAQETMRISHQSIFVHCGGDHLLFRERRGLSAVNPTIAAIVLDLIQTMTRHGLPENRIGILTPYTGQQRLLRAIFRSMNINVTVSTIEGSQGDEYAYCILDLVVHGGTRYPMGFIKDLRRMNVGLSRAKDGLVVVGYKDMTSHQHSTQGVQAWRYFVEHHVQGGWAFDYFRNDEEICRLFQIPGFRYEKTPRR